MTLPMGRGSFHNSPNVANILSGFGLGLTSGTENEKVLSAPHGDGDSDDDGDGDGDGDDAPSCPFLFGILSLIFIWAFTGLGDESVCDGCSCSNSNVIRIAL
mmetsp:Transcript_13068/g.19553  ORF Transcript_13068/g.19553 Transcript_13068/m.19553 type:complete len:102 (+) Transcript_13068:1156-1461(+)